MSIFIFQNAENFSWSFQSPFHCKKLKHKNGVSLEQLIKNENGESTIFLSSDVSQNMHNVMPYTPWYCVGNVYIAIFTQKVCITERKPNAIIGRTHFWTKTILFPCLIFYHRHTTMEMVQCCSVLQTMPYRWISII